MTCLHKAFFNKSLYLTLVFLWKTVIIDAGFNTIEVMVDNGY